MNVKKVVDHIAAWLTKYNRDSGLNGFVVGVSGGIDSAVTSTLCALTGCPVFVLNMPIRQDAQQETLSDIHIKWLTGKFENVKSAKLNLTLVLEAFEEVLPDELQDGLTMANSRSRIRMITLYAFAGHHKMIVAGTGNKVEDFGVGFFTKYGDGGVDVSPIADLLKTEVYQIGKLLEIDSRIISAPPTDGLWSDNRTDEKQIGASYEELEWAMAVTSGSIKENELTERQKKVLNTYRKFNSANKHKMLSIPVCQIPENLRK